MKATLLLLAALAGCAATASAADPFPVLYELEPPYSILNYTGWSTYPDCWLFPQAAVALVLDDQIYNVALLADAKDASGGRAVADAWCQRYGFKQATEWQQSDFSSGTSVQTLAVGGETVCTGTPVQCPAFKMIECVKGGAQQGCSWDPNTPTANRGYKNGGSANLGNFNTGSANVGDVNPGSANVGSFNSGSASVGYGLQCSACRGNTLPLP